MYNLSLRKKTGRKAVAFAAILGVLLSSAIFINPAHAEELLVACVADTAREEGGLSVSGSSSCTIPGDVTVTRATWEAELDDGGEVYVDGATVWAVENSQSIKQNNGGLGSFSAGQTFSVGVNARNAVDENGNGIGPVHGLAIVKIFGNRNAPPPPPPPSTPPPSTPPPSTPPPSTPPPSTPPPTTVIAAPTADIKANGSDISITIPTNTAAQISWTSSNATQCSVSPLGASGLSGSQTTGNLTFTTSYTIFCSGPGGTASDSVTVIVQQTGSNLACSPSTANPSVNQNVTFNATGGTGSYTWFGGGNPGTGSGSSFTTSFSSMGTQTVTVQSGGASAQCSVYLQGNLPTVTLNANPTFVYQNQPVLLNWYSTNANSCFASGGWSGYRNISGQETVYPSFTTTYTITCSNNFGVATDSRTVTVGNQQQPPYYPPINNNNVQITKTVFNRTLNNAGAGYYGSFGTQTDAQSLDVLEFEIRVRNLDYNNYGYYNSAVVRDILPQELFYVPGSTTLDGQSVGDGITTSGLNVPNLYQNQERVIRFRATVFAGVSNRTITNQATISAGSGVQNAFATINIRNRGQVLGAADIVTGPEDVLPWVLSLGFLGSILFYVAAFKYRLIKIGTPASQGPATELERLVLELRAEEKQPDTKRLSKHEHP